MRSTIVLPFVLSALLASPTIAQDAPDYGESLETHIGRAAASEIRRSARELIPRTGVTAVDRVARGVAGDYTKAAADAVRTDQRDRDRPSVEERRAERELRRAQREQRAADRERRREERRQEREGESGF
ncbi:hypothetical protein [Marinivivus vitaminiproducens]|uniref:hypothetical protein n=1 Tax=Marinivivus vitaminiproducens TaxID=3035935 RepID=UPI0027A7E6FB|nr:hypothetical protein P4R82_24910 [Geminicoccaceae bacterium SCSIO 64248]